MMNENYIKHVENFIDQENIVLHQCAELINQKIQLTNWPHDIKYAFCLRFKKKEKVLNHIRRIVQSGIYDLTGNCCHIQKYNIRHHYIFVVPNVSGRI
jgi:hypothetical protein